MPVGIFKGINLTRIQGTADWAEYAQNGQGEQDSRKNGKNVNNLHFESHMFPLVVWTTTFLVWTLPIERESS
jgi:hypothetical protein